MSISNQITLLVAGFVLFFCLCLGLVGGLVSVFVPWEPHWEQFIYVMVFATAFSGGVARLICWAFGSSLQSPGLPIAGIR